MTIDPTSISKATFEDVFWSWEFGVGKLEIGNCRFSIFDQRLPIGEYLSSHILTLSYYTSFLHTLTLCYKRNKCVCLFHLFTSWEHG